MTATVACTSPIPELEEAARVRGIRLVAFCPGVAADAALLDGDGGRVPRIRAQGWRGTLVLMLPAGASVAAALDAGADDAVEAGASADEIAARLAARIRRRAAIELGALHIDPLERQVTREGRPIPLLPREYGLLLHLARRPGRCVSRAELLSEVLSRRFDPGTNVLEVHISRLRAKLDRGFDVPMLRTEKGRGYLLAAV